MSRFDCIYILISGIPIIKILFSSHSGMSVISIPLLIYHPTQILIGGLLVPTIRGWLISKSKHRYLHILRVRVMVFNATFSNISSYIVIVSFLGGVLRENHRPVASY